MNDPSDPENDPELDPEQEQRVRDLLAGLGSAGATSRCPRRRPAPRRHAGRARGRARGRKISEEHTPPAGRPPAAAVDATRRRRRPRGDRARSRRAHPGQPRRTPAAGDSDEVVRRRRAARPVRPRPRLKGHRPPEQVRARAAVGARPQRRHASPATYAACWCRRRPRRVPGHRRRPAPVRRGARAHGTTSDLPRSGRHRRLAAGSSPSTGAGRARRPPPDGRQATRRGVELRRHPPIGQHHRRSVRLGR